jgi:hypothetical protein
MTPEPQEIVSGQNLAGRLLEVELGVVLSRVIGSIGRSEVMIEPREPLLTINQASTQTANTGQSTRLVRRVCR